MALRELPSDLERLGRLKDLGWLSGAQRKKLSDAMSHTDVKRSGLIFREEGRPNDEVYILLSGSARLTSRNPRRARVVVAMIAPGVIPKFPQLPAEVGHHLRCEAVSDCRLGKLSLDLFAEIVLGGRLANLAKFVETIVWPVGKLLARYPSFLDLSLRQRLATALLELAADFGIQDTRGTLLRISPTHSDLADMVGASRPRVTQTLLDLRHQRMLVCEGRRLVLKTRQLAGMLTHA